MSNNNSGPKVRKYLVSRDTDVLGTYTTERSAVAAAVANKGTIYYIERVQDCMAILSQVRSFEVV